MINVTGDLFEQNGWLCITTNGFVKNNERCVMGAGCAKIARDMVKGCDLVLGRKIKTNGNIVQCFGKTGKFPQLLLSFPVKHNWWENADIELIRKSAEQLRTIWLKHGKGIDVYIPRPGCGNGKLSYKDVEPVLRDILIEDAFKIITF
jgi:hypothetical protein